MFERLIGDEIWRAHGERFIFATAVHSLECWLLPLLFPDQKAKRAKLTGCLDAANHELRRQGRPVLTRGTGKDPDAYRAASDPYRKRRVLLAHVDHNLSLTQFVREVERRRIELPAEPT